MCYMERVGVRELRQNLSVYLERVKRGEALEVTERGRPVAVLAPLRDPEDPLERLRAQGRLRPAVLPWESLPEPLPAVPGQPEPPHPNPHGRSRGRGVTSAYVETSAMAKLVLDEIESRDLRDALQSHDGPRLTSELTVLELGRAARRGLGDTGIARARATILAFELLSIDRAVIDRASRIDPRSLRSLDAIHVASALALELPDVVFYSYDQRTIDAARANGLVTASPGID